MAELRDGLDGRIGPRTTSRSLATYELDANHPLTAESSGATAAIPGFGLLGDLFDHPFVVHWQIADGVARLPDLPGVAMRGHPFLGFVAVAPSEELFENRELDLALAARRALEELVSWLADERGLTREQGYVLASVAADLSIARSSTSRTDSFPAGCRSTSSRTRPSRRRVSRVHPRARRPERPRRDVRWR